MDRWVAGCDVGETRGQGDRGKPLETWTLVARQGAAAGALCVGRTR